MKQGTLYHLLNVLSSYSVRNTNLKTDDYRKLGGGIGGWYKIISTLKDLSMNMSTPYPS